MKFGELSKSTTGKVVTKESSLGQFYDDLKSGMDAPTTNPHMMRVGTPEMGMRHPGTAAWKHKALCNSNQLRDDCRKHILLDIYCKILPLDDEWKSGHKGELKNDIDRMLDDKGMDSTQYITSAYESTNAPLIQYLLWATDKIGNKYMAEANDTLKDAQENNIEVPEPEAPSIDDQEIDNQLIEVKKDQDYEGFIDKLKEKTINKIVSDVSKIINNKKEEQSMAFNPQPISAEKEQMESVLSIGMDYIERKLLSEGVVADANLHDEMMGLAIREATIDQMNRVFEQVEPGFNLSRYDMKLRLGKGVLINESTAAYFVESAKGTKVDDVVNQAKKECDDKINSKLKASDVLENEEEKKKKEDQTQ